MSLETIYATARQAAVFSSAADTLEWDERTGMPHAGSEYRATQIAALRTQAHSIATDPKYGELLSKDDAELDIEADSIDAGNLRLLRRDYHRQSKLPGELVHETARVTAVAQQIWQTSRQNNCFADFESTLQEVVSLKRRAGEIFVDGTNDQPYDGLLEEYEPGMTGQQVASIFDSLRGPLVELIQNFRTDDDDPDVALMRRHYPIAVQRELSAWAAAFIGFDFDRGRLDETTHPFCTTLGPHDIRILSRYETNWLPGGLFGSLHEAGHGMYEQGLPTKWFGLPAGTYSSLGVHESQSRLWENQIGRSLGFAKLCLPHLQSSAADGDLVNYDADAFHRGVNSITPSLIRVEADEATYNLHIMIRFDLERSLIDGSLRTADLPEAWNQRYKTDLGLDVPTDRQGVLQDVHWSAGLIGYFPTYTIGNLVSAQLFGQATKDLSLQVDELTQEDCVELRQWLTKHVFQHGRLKTTQQIVEDATGTKLSDKNLIDYLRQKHIQKQSAAATSAREVI